MRSGAWATRAQVLREEAANAIADAPKAPMAIQSRSDDDPPEPRDAGVGARAPAGLCLAPPCDEFSGYAFHSCCG
jgi:hypothetical protein